VLTDERSRSELVQRLASKRDRSAAIRALVGGLTATELRSVHVDDATIDALSRGLTDPNPVVRWWCVQLLDHVPEPRAIDLIVPMLDDPVARVRRNAVHALGCAACKPTADVCLTTKTLARIRELADSDPNGKVRDEASRLLA
jgi:HEAT repeat protein